MSHVSQMSNSMSRASHMRNDMNSSHKHRIDTGHLNMNGHHGYNGHSANSWGDSVMDRVLHTVTDSSDSSDSGELSNSLANHSARYSGRSYNVPNTAEAPIELLQQLEFLEDMFDNRLPPSTGAARGFA